jgi:hypothetical protein
LGSKLLFVIIVVIVIVIVIVVIVVIVVVIIIRAAATVVTTITCGTPDIVGLTDRTFVIVHIDVAGATGLVQPTVRTVGILQHIVVTHPRYLQF